MMRFLSGVLAAMLLMAGGLFWWKSAGHAADPLPRAPAALVYADGAQPAPVLDPPSASDKTREEKRFDRYDKDRDGKVARAEYLAGRQKAFAKLDTNGDGRLSFEEYSAKAIAKFTDADKDRSGVLNPTEFAATKIARKTARPRPNCPPAAEPPADD